MKFAVIHNHPIHYKHLLFQELAKTGAALEVVFLASGSKTRHESIGLSQNLYRYRIGFKGPYESAPAISRLTFAWRALSDIRPDLVVISGYYAIECWAAWLWAGINRRPMVMWYESNEFDYPRHWYKEIPKKIFVKRLNGAHVYGLSNKAYLVRLGMRQESITLKRAVVDIEKFSGATAARTYSDSHARRLIYVGRLAPEKNLSFLLRALARANSRMPGSALFLTIAGTGPLEEQLRGEAASLGVERFVEFAGYCPQHELPALYRKADFLVLPSVREPWGLVSLEAMLCGLPVLISTQCGCAADVVTRESGWSFSPWDERELVEILTQLPVIGAERLAVMGSRARTIALDYSAQLCAERIVQSLGAIQYARTGNPSVAVRTSE